MIKKMDRTKEQCNDALLRGTLPLVWMGMVVAFVLLYGFLPYGSTHSTFFAYLKHWLSPVFFILLSIPLTIATLFLGCPSIKEFFYATLSAVFAIAIMAALAILIGPAHFALHLIILFILVIPLSRLFFLGLM